jgi:hypothetical protein
MSGGPARAGGRDEAGFVLPAVLAILIVVSAAAATAALRLQTRTALRASTFRRTASRSPVRCRAA